MAVAPRIWPSTTAGLIIGPQSSTTRYRGIVTCPVSPSISTQQQCVDCEKPPPSPSYVAEASSSRSTPSGIIDGAM